MKNCFYHIIRLEKVRTSYPVLVLSFHTHSMVMSFRFIRPISNRHYCTFKEPEAEREGFYNTNRENRVKIIEAKP